MSRQYSLDLFQNAIDSLQESVGFYKLAINDESKYKFSIILFFHFAELMLKHFVENINPLLCYERPFSDRITEEKTITWKQAIQVLHNSGMPLDNDLRSQLKSLSKLRNNITHYKFSYSTTEIRKIIIDVAAELSRLHFAIFKKDFYGDVNELTKELLREIEDAYRKELHLAHANASEEAEGEILLDCEMCGEKATVTIREQDDSVIYYCHFCHEEDDEEECVRCTQAYRKSMLSLWGETEEGDALYMCEYCLDHIERE